MASSITVTIEFPVLIKDKGEYFVASCESLDIHAEGSSRREAKRRIMDALDVFVSTCIEMGTLEEVMKESGYEKIVHDTNSKPDLNEEIVSVPFSLLAANNRGITQAHAY